MSIRLTIDRLKDIHSYINDPKHEEFSGYIYFKDNEIKYIDGKKSEYINKPPITPKNLFYDYLSFHTHPKKGLNIPGNQDIPSYTDLIFVKNTILNNECEGHILFTPFYVYYITINKNKIKSDSFIKSTYYNTIHHSKDPDFLEQKLAFAGILLKHVKSNGYINDIDINTSFLKKEPFNEILCVSIVITVLFIIIYCFTRHTNFGY